MKSERMQQRKKRLRYFAVVGTLLLLLQWGVVWYRLIARMGFSSHSEAGLLFLCLVGFLAQVWRWSDSSFLRNHSKLVFLIYFSLGLLVHLFLGTLAKDFFLLLSSPFASFSASELIGIHRCTGGLCLVLNIWGVVTALKGPVVKEVEIPVSQLPKELSGFTFVQVSDLHVGPIIGRKYVASVVEKVNKLDSEFVAITGDLGDGRVNDLEQGLQPLGSLRAKTYYVSGNHEYYWNIDEWEQKVQEMGMRLLHNSGERITVHEGKGISLWVGGVPDFSAHRMREGDKFLPHQAAPKSGHVDVLKILLAHQPNSCIQAYSAGFDLMLSGHTHAGQFFPFSQIVGFFNRYYKGLNLHEGKMWVYVSSGTGFWGPPVRLWVPSEITRFTLTPA